MTTSKRKRSEDSSAADEPSKKLKPTDESGQTEELNSKIHDAEVITIDASLKVQPWESTDIQALVKQTLNIISSREYSGIFLAQTSPIPPSSNMRVFKSHRLCRKSGKKNCHSASRGT